MNSKQVDKSHYQFSKYMNKERWLSMYHQLDEVIKLNPESVLEIGVGTGLLRAMIQNYNIKVETVDIDSDLMPDHIASATSLPFQDNTYDCVCAFQMLEHLPYKESIIAFKEMVRITKKNVIISLPNAKILLYYSLHIPKIGNFSFNVPRPRMSLLKHEFNGEHYWEINKEGYALDKVIKDFEMNNVRLIRQYRVKEFSYHHFFVFEKGE